MQEVLTITRSSRSALSMSVRLTWGILVQREILAAVIDWDWTPQRLVATAARSAWPWRSRWCRFRRNAAVLEHRGNVLSSCYLDL